LLSATSDGGHQRLWSSRRVRRREHSVPAPHRSWALPHALGWRRSRLHRRSWGAAGRASATAGKHTRKRTATAPVELQRVGWCGLARHLLGPLLKLLAALQLACNARQFRALRSSAAAAPRASINRLAQRVHEAVRIHVRARAAQPVKHPVQRRASAVGARVNKPIATQTHWLMSPPKRVNSSLRSRSSSALPRYVRS
jgi:hypothetical protein